VGDRLARVGDEEFLVILPESNAANAVAIAERIHDALTTPHFRRRRHA